MGFFKHGIHTGIFSVIIQIISLGIGIINARILGPEVIGILALLLILKNLSFTLIQLGFGTSLRYFVARKAFHDGIENQITVYFSVLSCLIIVPFILFVWNRNFSIWKDIDQLYIYLYVLIIVCYIFINYFKSILNGRLEIEKVNYADLLLSSINFIGVAILVLGFSFGILGAIVSILMAHIIVMIYLSYSIGFFKNLGKGNSLKSPYDHFKILYLKYCIGILFKSKRSG